MRRRLLISSNASKRKQTLSELLEGLMKDSLMRIQESSTSGAQAENAGLKLVPTDSDAFVRLKGDITNNIVVSPLFYSHLKGVLVNIKLLAGTPLFYFGRSEIRYLDKKLFYPVKALVSLTGLCQYAV